MSARGEFAPAVCPFCHSAVADPGPDAVSNCPGCNACYWVEAADDVAGVADEAAEMLEVEPDQVECSIIRNYDRWTDDEDQPTEAGEEVCLVFARVKPPS